jgi:hypothetical protein
MKSTGIKNSGWMAFGLAALLAAPAFAGEGDKPAKGDKPPRSEDFRQKMLQEFDTDGDGQLSDDERTKMRDARRERGAGGRGGPGNEARRGGPGGPGGPGMMMDPGRMFDRVDEDGDGSVTREEFVGFFERMREMRGGPGGPGADRIGRRPGGERGRPEGRPEGRRGRRGPAEDKRAKSEETESKPAAEAASADVPL